MRSRVSNKRAQNTLNRMINDKAHYADVRDASSHQFRDPMGDAAAKQESDSGSDSGSDSDSDDEKKIDPRKAQ